MNIFPSPRFVPDPLLFPLFRIGTRDKNGLCEFLKWLPTIHEDTVVKLVVLSLVVVDCSCAIFPRFWRLSRYLLGDNAFILQLLIVYNVFGNLRKLQDKKRFMLCIAPNSERAVENMAVEGNGIVLLLALLFDKGLDLSCYLVLSERLVVYRECRSCGGCSYLCSAGTDSRHSRI